MAGYPICYKCKKPICSNEIVALGRFWHAHCFICTRCRRALDEKDATLQDDSLFHVACKPLLIAEVPRPTNARLPDWMLQAGTSPTSDSLHYPSVRNYRNPLEKFLCGICHKPIGQSPFVHHKRSMFHADCFATAFDPECAICSNPINGSYYIDSWGNVYCAYHYAVLADCDECGRKVCQELTGGGVTYPDGRLVCNLCRRKAVDTADQVRSSMKRVHDILGKNGLLIDESMFPIQLVDRAEMDLRAKKLAGANVTGLFQPIIKRDGSRGVKAIYILWGKPAYSFEGTLAHELGHAWFYLNHIDGLNRTVEEGLCNVLKYVVCCEQDILETTHTVRRLFLNPDPVYGEGFRQAQKCLATQSVGALMRFVAMKKTLPPM